MNYSHLHKMSKSGGHWPTVLLGGLSCSPAQQRWPHSTLILVQELPSTCTQEVLLTNGPW